MNEYFSNSFITRSIDVMKTLPEPFAARQARGEQILIAAGELLIRHGYQRITMEDVARHAGVGTGTLYLHWKTKEMLFETVLLRELITIWSELAQRLDTNPADALLHRFLGYLLRAVKERPLAQALFTRDSTLLGKLAQRSVVLEAQPLANGVQLISTLRELGLVRSDVALDVQAYAFSAIWAGFSLVDPLLTGDDRVSLDTQIQALTHIIRCTFEPDSLPDDAALRTRVVPALREFLDRARAAFEQHIQARMLPVR
jgi:AcrR family transcriptional regulator